MFFGNNLSPIRRNTNFVCRYTITVHQTHPSGTHKFQWVKPLGARSAFMFFVSFLSSFFAHAYRPNCLIFKTFVKTGRWWSREEWRAMIYLAGVTWLPEGSILGFVLGMTLSCIHIFIVTVSFLYWCVMRPACQHFFKHSCSLFIYESWSNLI